MHFRCGTICSSQEIVFSLLGRSFMVACFGFLEIRAWNISLPTVVIAASVNGHGSLSSLEPLQQDNPIQKSIINTQIIEINEMHAP